jgi:APA family basic amino acid/polyamine antiporter
VILTLFNTFTIRSSEWFANISTVAKLVGILALLVVALMLGDRAIFSEAEGATEVTRAAASSWDNLAAAFVSVLWTYSGWHYATFVAGDAINPKRNIPLAMIIGTSIVTVIYLLCNAGYLRVFDTTELAAQSGTLLEGNVVAINAINHVLPGTGVAAAILIAISVFGGAGMYVLSTPRVIKVMSEQGLFFPAFGRPHPKFGVPMNALLLQSAWAIVLVYFWGNFEAIINYVTISEQFFLLFACASLFIVRAKLKGQPAPFKSVLNPFLAVIYCAVVAWFIVKNVDLGNKEGNTGLLLIPAGVVVYLLFNALSKKKSNPAN